MASLTEGRIPATVLVGFLGAGKTTLLNHFLRQQQGRRYAVIVNDFSEIGIDARLVSQQTERVIELANGSSAAPCARIWWRSSRNWAGAMTSMAS